MPHAALARVASAVTSVRTTLTSSDLKTRATAIKGEISALNAAQSAMSVAFLEGDGEAIAACSEIDVRRAALVSELGHIDNAIPEVSQRERAQTPFNPRDLERLKARLKLRVTHERESLTYNLTEGLFKERQRRSDEVHAALVAIDPLTIARELVGAIVKQVVAYDGEERARLTAERHKTIDRLARELVAATELPPLPPEIAKLQS